MVSFPAPDRYDLAAVVGSLLLLLFAYLVYPDHIVIVTAWLSVFTISVAWMGYFAYRLAFETGW